MDSSLQDILTTQKKFIHDIASPVSIIQGLIEIMLSQLKDKNLDDKAVIEKLEKVFKASAKIESLVHANRNYLSGQG